MKTNHLVIICLTIYLCVFTNGCWKSVDNALSYYLESMPVNTPEQIEPAKIENPILKEDIPQLFMVPAPNLQEQDMPVEEKDENTGKPKTFA